MIKPKIDNRLSRFGIRLISPIQGVLLEGMVRFLDESITGLSVAFCDAEWSPGLDVLSHTTYGSKELTVWRLDSKGLYMSGFPVMYEAATPARYLVILLNSFPVYYLDFGENLHSGQEFRLDGLTRLLRFGAESTKERC